jgi:hypothetical protein
LPAGAASFTVNGAMLSTALMSTTLKLTGAPTGVAWQLSAPRAGFEVRHTDAASGV